MKEPEYDVCITEKKRGELKSLLKFLHPETVLFVPSNVAGKMTTFRAQVSAIGKDTGLSFSVHEGVVKEIGLGFFVKLKIKCNPNLK
jgi:hypothetical protein